MFGLDSFSMALGGVLGIVDVLQLVVGAILLSINIIVRVISRTKIEVSIGTRF
jgi:hypothetical protein